MGDRRATKREDESQPEAAPPPPPRTSGWQPTSARPVAALPDLGAGHAA